ncbi:MAG: 2-hydroxycarboxylate transporter family protein [Burkholderia sp.]|jgi:malate:Na+ symporter|uniref:2-hydroxycarboxylate transporter family protein n=3 Tax=Burkholderiaceae TaxID=119060 RepID=UPI001CF3B09F|nr:MULTISPECIES: 2-hydroxycarboxylate transporter family protein [Burkholderia]MCA3782286.1 2-hydroxycarboxylate transporter family protein [Burkholderia sp.]MCA3791323.1 2-hydroxycarboxylate transporter family protein [Burkholderia sp.]MCA3803049.1 2-hydroxycarboxylate transporter family protein [Burkholderia sp.]MCA3810586.1 2-hydroxycarboxylate transporter family protein [Burkholderia sp.]MCA3819812.1 2-hydroxycarboxylate transporter family protein [Burkholderia sp.]
MDASPVQANLPQSTRLSSLLNLKVGGMPLPMFVAIAIVTVLAAATKRLPNDMIGGFAVLMLSGLLLGEIGRRIPVFRHIGGPAILCLFVPSALLGYRLMDDATLKAITVTMKTANLQYLYIACLVAGSMLGMNRKILIQGFLKMFAPLVVGTAAAIAAGIAVGLAFGHDPQHTFFYIVMPILGGGIGEGILPLSIGYSEITGAAQGHLIAMMVPAALIGNVVAILASGMLKRFGEKHRSYSGDGLLVKTGEDRELLAAQKAEAALDLRLMGFGLLLACTLFILGGLLAPLTGIPGPVLMIVAAAVLKVCRAIPESMEIGAYQMYKFMSTNLTFAILVGLGTLFVSWDKLVGAFSPGYFVICASVVIAMVVSGFFVGAALKMYPVESAIITACHSGLGGTGDVAILSSSNRMGLMPFAQISTRIGGAAMVVLATIVMKWLH